MRVPGRVHGATRFANLARRQFHGINVPQGGTGKPLWAYQCWSLATKRCQCHPPAILSPIHRRPTIWFIFVTLVIDVLGIGLVIPVAPNLVKELLGPAAEAAVSAEPAATGATPTPAVPATPAAAPATDAKEGESEEDSRAALAVTALTTTYLVMQLLFAPVLGSLSDQVGRRPVILISLLGTGLDYIVMAFAPNLWWLFVTRAISGITGANYSVASAYIADVTPPEKRAAGFGLMGAAFGIGFVFGPLIGGLLGDSSRHIPFVGAGDVRYPFMVAGALALLNTLYGVFVLRESLPRERRRPFALHRAHPIGALRRLARYPLASGLAWTLFLVMLAHFGLRVVWVLYTQYRYGWSEAEVGLSLALVGIAAAVVQGGLARTLIPRMGEARAVRFGLVLAMLQYAAFGLATQGWMIYVILTLGAVGAVFGPAAQSLISRNVPAEEQGEVQGAVASLQSLAGIPGTIVGGSLFSFFVSPSSPIILPGAPFFLSALVLLGAYVLAAAVLRRRLPDAGVPGSDGREASRH